jgi:hypothetical protein
MINSEEISRLTVPLKVKLKNRGKNVMLLSLSNQKTEQNISNFRLMKKMFEPIDGSKMSICIYWYRGGFTRCFAIFQRSLDWWRKWLNKLMEAKCPFAFIGTGEGPLPVVLPSSSDLWIDGENRWTNWW